MTLTNWFEKELCIRFTDEGDGFVSTARYHMTHLKVFRFRSQEIVPLVPQEETESANVEVPLSVRAYRKIYSDLT